MPLFISNIMIEEKKEENRVQALLHLESVGSLVGIPKG